MRWCHDIIDRMVEKIPKDKKDFLGDLAWNKEDSYYKAPEETLQWERTQQTLERHIPKPSKDWEWEVLSIFTTKPTEELKQVFK